MGPWPCPPLGSTMKIPRSNPCPTLPHPISYHLTPSHSISPHLIPPHCLPLLSSGEYGPPTLKEQIIQGRYSYPEGPWISVSPGAKDLLEWMLQVDIRRRATVDDCLADPWITVSGVEGERRKRTWTQLQSINLTLFPFSLSPREKIPCHICPKAP